MLGKLEILIAGQGIATYSLCGKSEFVIGSSDACDIKIKDLTISKKHLKLEVIDDHHYVTDLDSTNGTYLNNKKLSPNQKVEITGRLPLRLGHKVLLTFSDEAQGSESSLSRLMTTNQLNEDGDELKGSGDTKTHAVDSDTLRRAKTDKLVKQRKVMIKKTPLKSKRPTRNKMIVNASVALILGGLYYKKKYQETETLSPSVETTSKLKPRTKALVPASTLTLPMEFAQRSDFAKYEQYITCDKPVEKYFCDLIPETKNLGVVQVEEMVNLMLNGEEYLKAAHAELYTYSTEINASDVNKVAAIKFFHALSSDLNDEMLIDKNLTFAFYQHFENEKSPRIQFLVAIKGSKLKELKSKIKDGHFLNLKKVGAVVFTYTKDYLSIY